MGCIQNEPYLSLEVQPHKRQRPMSCFRSMASPAMSPDAYLLRPLHGPRGWHHGTTSAAMSLPHPRNFIAGTLAGQNPTVPTMPCALVGTWALTWDSEHLSPVDFKAQIDHFGIYFGSGFSGFVSFNLYIGP